MPSPSKAKGTGTQLGPSHGFAWGHGDSAGPGLGEEQDGAWVPLPPL